MRLSRLIMTQCSSCMTDLLEPLVSEVSLTEQMMKTVKAAVLAGCSFGEDAFPIIRSLMYMDGMVLKGHPNVDLISSMGPYLDEFATLIDPKTLLQRTPRSTLNLVDKNRSFIKQNYSVKIMSETKQPSVAIIGAGPGGLASALLLAKSGVKVTVFEICKSRRT